ncbi:MAG: PAS domain-containing protein, partial [Deltaproteobacteria bacterium]|nr:PAS domain-containing protein [Deltaproteobacteria bacterium]
MAPPSKASGRHPIADRISELVGQSSDTPLRGWVEPRAEAARPEANATVSRPSSKRILVVDDNDAIHEDFRKILSNHGHARELEDIEVALFGSPSVSSEVQQQYAVDVARQGQEGLARLVQARADGAPFAMAFVDMRMPPGWDGLETSLRLLAEDPFLQIVICTAYSDYSWEQMVQKLGRSDRVLILKKPFEPIEVRQLVHALCEKWLLTRQAAERMERLETAVQARTTALALMNARLAVLIEASPAGIVALNQEGQVTAWNPAAQSIFGLPAAAAIGRTLRSLELNFAGQSELFQKTGLLARAEEALRTSCSENLEVREERPDGSAVWLACSLVPFLNAGQAHVLMTLEDVTPRRLAAEELRAAQSMLQTVLDAIPQYICWKGRDLRILGCNRAFAQLARLPMPADGVGKRTEELPALVEHAAGLFAKAGEVMERDAPEHHANDRSLVAGVPRWFDTTRIPLHD